MAVSDPGAAVRAEPDLPVGAPTERPGGRELEPPGSLTNSPDTLAAVEDDAVLVRVTGRTSQRLYSTLATRGKYGAVERADATITALWKP